MTPTVKRIILNPSLEVQVRNICRRNGYHLFTHQPANVFQDSSGVTAGSVGSVMGLEFDIGQGGLGNPGVNKLLNPTGLGTVDSGWSVSLENRSYTATGAAAFSAGRILIPAFSAGAYVLLEYLLTLNSGSVRPQFAGGAGVNGVTRSASGRYSEIIFVNTNNNSVNFQALGSGFDGAITDVSVRELPGKHATQTTTADKPILRQTSGRYWMDMADGTDKLTFSGLSGYTASTLIHSVLGTGQTTLEAQDISAGYNWTQDNSTGLVICRTAPSPRDLAMLQRYMNKLAGV